MDLLRGLHTPPWLVSLARGIAGAVVAFGLVWLADAANVATLPEQAQWFVPLVVLVLRQVEGGLDQADPAKSSEGHAAAGQPLPPG